MKNIFRSNKSLGNFTLIDNAIIYNANLSDNAKVILIYMLSKIDSWQFHEDEIAKSLNKSIRTIRRGIEELEKNGYLTRKRYRNKDGKFGYEFKVYESPQVKNDLRNKC